MLQRSIGAVGVLAFAASLVLAQAAAAEDRSADKARKASPWYRMHHERTQGKKLDQLNAEIRTGFDRGRIKAKITRKKQCTDYCYNKYERGMASVCYYTLMRCPTLPD